MGKSNNILKNKRRRRERVTLEKKQLQKLLQNLSIAKKWFLSEKFLTQEAEMRLRKEFLFRCKNIKL